MDIENTLRQFKEGEGRLTVLNGAGISAESGIPTFRGPEGYWTVGSKEYRPEQMATYAMFSRDPWAVWAWYLYRRTICMNAEPNNGHMAIAEMERIFGNRFRLITQNVDGLHLRAGNTDERTFQIHGNIHSIRCGRNCSSDVFPFPSEIKDKGKNMPVTDQEKEHLICPLCKGIARPHVLWFDECYEENFFRSESALEWAVKTDMLMVIGTAGATNLPMQIGGMVSRNPDAILMDINIDDNPFRRLAKEHPRGIVMEGPGSENLMKILAIWEN